MSYLDLPRLHFGGLFFANPSTLNNTTQNFLTSTPLLEPDGSYRTDFAGGAWDPLGVAHFFLQSCRVLGAVDASGVFRTTGDPILGASVRTVAPGADNGWAGGLGIGKIVDLDPDQQSRSALYGLQLCVAVAEQPGQVVEGLFGVLSVPSIRFLGFKTNPPVRIGSWKMGCEWQASIDAPSFVAGSSTSPLLGALRAAAGANGLSVKLGVDLHRNDSAFQLQQGDHFCYGRVHGTIGPARAGEPRHFVAARRLRATPIQVSATDRMTTARSHDNPLGLAAEAEAALVTVTNVQGASALVRESDAGGTVSIDLGNSLPFGSQAGTSPSGLPTDVSDGTLLTSRVQVGYLDTSGAFRPFVRGRIDLGPFVQRLTTVDKACLLLTNGMVVDVPISAQELAFIEPVSVAGGAPLAVIVGDGAVPQLVEPRSGYYLDIDENYGRAEQGPAAVVLTQTLRLFRFGKPVANSAVPATFQVVALAWNGTQGPTPTPTTAITVTVAATDASGRAPMKVALLPNALGLQGPRVPMGSLVFVVQGTPTAAVPDVILSDQDSLSGSPDGGSGLFTLLAFARSTPPSSPTWADVQPVLAAYARLYPGMKSQLDISDRATALAVAPVLAERMDPANFAQPFYMPVTRDLAPSRAAMIAAWFRGQPPSASPLTSTRIPRRPQP